jgi:hypothetical protein
LRVAKTSTKARPAHDLDALAEEYRLWNGRQARPMRECASCRHPTRAGDWDPIRTDLCVLCGARWVEGMMKRIRRRLGRKGLIAALEKLADPD